MKLGIVVDGSAESQALKKLLKDGAIPDVQVLPPAYADMQPRATPAQMARAASASIAQLRARNVDKIVVLIDREANGMCPVDGSDSIEAAFLRLGFEDIAVVVKDSCYENWLIADIDALRQLRGLFDVTSGFENRVAPNKADNVSDAERELNRISRRGKRYHKRTTAVAIAEKQDCLRIAANSRSFRRFLHLAGHPAYEGQSRRPT